MFRRNIQDQIRRSGQILQCGGAAGHMQHLFDNSDLTFAELKDVLTQAADGKLESVTEKLDGVNLVFTWHLSEGLRVARTGKDIKSGGMDAHTLAKKFFGRGNVEEAFTVGFKVLQQAIGALDKKTLISVFGHNGNFWYSIELIYSKLANTINYDSDHIVFHQSPVFEIEGGLVSVVKNPTGVTTLERNVNMMQNAIKMKNWKVRGPALVRLKKISDGSILNRAIQTIDQAQAEAGVGDSDTISDYMYGMAVNEAQATGLSQEVVKLFADRMSNRPGAPNVSKLKKADPTNAREIESLVKQEKLLKAKWISPIEIAVHNFALEVLRGLESSLIADSSGEVRRLRTILQTSIDKINSSGNANAMDVLNKQMHKLKSVENIASPMEGIVFMYKGRAYKFTGAFAPAHQIISLFTFHKEQFGESRNRRGILLEGGHAFNNVKPIKLSVFKSTYPTMIEDLQDLGLKKITPIGTTGKKELMGDVDLAAEYEGGRDELFSQAVDVFSVQNVKKVGSNIVTISYPTLMNGVETGERVQVDVMLGDTNYMSWSRYGPSQMKDDPGYSPIKGVVRNVLLSTVLTTLAHEQFPDQQDEYTQVKYVVDFDKGLYKVKKSRAGALDSSTGLPRVLKTWRAVERELITSDPNEIVEIMFGDDYTTSDIARIEDLIDVIKHSDKTSHYSNEILSKFNAEIEELMRKNPNTYVGDLEQTLDYIRGLI